MRIRIQRGPLVAIACVAAIAVGVVFLYGSLLRFLFDEMITTDWLAPLAVLPMLAFYVARREGKGLVKAALHGLATPISIWRGVLSATAIFCALVLLFASKHLYLRSVLGVASMVLFLMGTTLLSFGDAVARRLAPAYLLLFTLISPTEVIATVYLLGRDLGFFVTKLAADLLRVLGYQVEIGHPFKSPFYTLILYDAEGKPHTIAVGAPCLGMYSALSFAAVGAFLAYASKGPRWARLFMIAAGASILFFLNVFRVAILAIANAFWGVQALDTLHTVLGLVFLLIGTIVIAILFGKLFGIEFFPVRVPRIPCPRCLTEWRSRLFCRHCGLSAPLDAFTRLRPLHIVVVVLVLAVVASALFAHYSEQPLFTVRCIEPREEPYIVVGGKTYRVLPPIEEWGLQPEFVSGEYGAITTLGMEYMFWYDYKRSDLVALKVIFEIAPAFIHEREFWETCIPGARILYKADIVLNYRPFVAARIYHIRAPPGYIGGEIYACTFLSTCTALTPHHGVVRWIVRASVFTTPEYARQSGLVSENDPSLLIDLVRRAATEVVRYWLTFTQSSPLASALAYAFFEQPLIGTGGLAIFFAILAYFRWQNTHSPFQQIRELLPYRGQEVTAQELERRYGISSEEAYSKLLKAEEYRLVWRIQRIEEGEYIERWRVA